MNTQAARGPGRRPRAYGTDAADVDPDTVRDVLAGLDGEWQPAVLVHLERGPMRSADLRRAVSPAVDWRTFINTVNRLQTKGLIVRHASPMDTGEQREPFRSRPGAAARIADDSPNEVSAAFHGDGARERVTYELTDIGRSVLALLAEVDAWARNHPDHAHRIRRRRQ